MSTAADLLYSLGGSVWFLGVVEGGWVLRGRPWGSLWYGTCAVPLSLIGAAPGPDLIAIGTGTSIATLDQIYERELERASQHEKEKEKAEGDDEGIRRQDAEVDDGDKEETPLEEEEESSSTTTTTTPIRISPQRVQMIQRARMENRKALLKRQSKPMMTNPPSLVATNNTTPTLIAAPAARNSPLWYPNRNSQRTRMFVATLDGRPLPTQFSEALRRTRCLLAGAGFVTTVWSYYYCNNYSRNNAVGRHRAISESSWRDFWGLGQQHDETVLRINNNSSSNRYHHDQQNATKEGTTLVLSVSKPPLPSHPVLTGSPQPPNLFSSSSSSLLFTTQRHQHVLAVEGTANDDSELAGVLEIFHTLQQAAVHQRLIGSTQDAVLIVLANYHHHHHHHKDTTTTTMTTTIPMPENVLRIQMEGIWKSQLVKVVQSWYQEELERVENSGRNQEEEEDSESIQSIGTTLSKGDSDDSSSDGNDQDQSSSSPSSLGIFELVGNTIRTGVMNLVSGLVSAMVVPSRPSKVLHLLSDERSIAQSLRVALLWMGWKVVWYDARNELDVRQYAFLEGQQQRFTAIACSTDEMTMAFVRGFGVREGEGEEHRPKRLVLLEGDAMGEEQCDDHVVLSSKVLQRRVFQRTRELLKEGEIALEDVYAFFEQGERGAYSSSSSSATSSQPALA